MKILVTGIAGAIGSHVGERFLELGYEVIGIDSFTSYYDPAIKKINAKDVIKKGGKIYEYDLAEDDFTKVLKDVEVIFHFAAQPGISSKTKFEEYTRNNIIATQRLLEAAMKVPTLKLFVHISTSSVYGVRAQGNEKTVPEPTSHYGVTKLAAEQLALSYYREFGLPVTVFRLFSVYGPRERPEKLFHKLIKSILEKKDFPLFQGSEYHKRSFTYVGDVVDACVSALTVTEKTIGEIFNIGGGATATTQEGIAVIEDLLGHTATITILPKRPGDQFETKADISKARDILGFEPSTALWQGLEKQVEWYKSKIYNKI
ncbi:MAG: NAD-dependent epimerase/dehydratase family protein [Candidatus Paceibacterota bacterium]|jgi:nucleoside-diphosphate-sugar epimerase